MRSPTRVLGVLAGLSIVGAAVGLAGAYLTRPAPASGFSQRMAVPAGLSSVGAAGAAGAAVVPGQPGSTAADGAGSGGSAGSADGSGSADGAGSGGNTGSADRSGSASAPTGSPPWAGGAGEAAGRPVAWGVVRRVLGGGLLGLLLAAALLPLVVIGPPVVRTLLGVLRAGVAVIARGFTAGLRRLVRTARSVDRRRAASPPASAVPAAAAPAPAIAPASPPALPTAPLPSEPAPAAPEPSPPDAAVAEGSLEDWIRSLAAAPVEAGEDGVAAQEAADPPSRAA